MSSENDYFDFPDDLLPEQNPSCDEVESSSLSTAPVQPSSAPSARSNDFLCNDVEPVQADEELEEEEGEDDGGGTVELARKRMASSRKTNSGRRRKPQVPRKINSKSMTASAEDQGDHQASISSRNSNFNNKVPCEDCGRLFAKRYLSAHRRSHIVSSNGRRSAAAAASMSNKSEEESASSNVETSSSEASSDQEASRRSQPPKTRNKDRYLCYICDRPFSKLDMAAHMRTHVDDENVKNYVCYVCDRPFAKKDMATHQLTCCKKSSSSRVRAAANATAVRRQRGSSTPSKKVGAASSDVETTVDANQEAGEVEGDKFVLDDRKRKRYRCDMCGGLYRKSYLAEHKRSHTGEKPYQCSKCDKQFASAVTMKVHLKNFHSEERGNIKCNVCGRMMSSKMSLEQHLLTHSNEKPFQCEVCGKAFKQSSVLSNHIKTHCEGTPYQCHQCGNQYKSAQGLIMHRRRHHEGIRLSFPCDLCEKSFTRRMKLKDHIMWHKGVSPYKCPYCSKRLVSKKTLRTHVLIHENKKPYECSVCGKSFRQNCVLKRHMSVHTGIKPFQCQHCGKQFIHRVYLAKHTCDMMDGAGKRPPTFLTL